MKFSALYIPLPGFKQINSLIKVNQPIIESFNTLIIVYMVFSKIKKKFLSDERGKNSIEQRLISHIRRLNDPASGLDLVIKTRGWIIQSIILVIHKVRIMPKGTVFVN